MPLISRFFGISVYIYWRDHAPPHFHAKYQGQEVSVDIETGEVNGRMSNRALAMLEEWRELHHRELIENWQRATTKKPLVEIPPLE